MISNVVRNVYECECCSNKTEGYVIIPWEEIYKPRGALLWLQQGNNLPLGWYYGPVTEMTYDRYVGTDVKDTRTLLLCVGCRDAKGLY